MLYCFETSEIIKGKPVFRSRKIETAFKNIA